MYQLPREFGELENGRHFDFLNVAIVTSTYARHILNARNELLA